MAETQAQTVEIDEIIHRYEGDCGMLIPMMQDVQAACGYLPQEKLKELSANLGVPLAQIYSVATFYASFRLMPKGEHTIQLCMGTVCFLKGAGGISEALQEQFQLVPGGTSPDGKFTFAPVNCLGACALAPVMVVDDEYHGNLTVESAVELLHKIAAGAEAEGTEAPSAAEAEAAADVDAQTATEAQLPAEPGPGKRAPRGAAGSKSKRRTPSTKQKRPRGGQKQ